MEDRKDIYQGGYAQLVKDHQERCTPFKNVEAVLPDADIDLRRLFHEVVETPAAPVPKVDDLYASTKWAKLQHEFKGQSALLLLHAMLIAISRRSTPPQRALDIFFRCWVELGPELAQALPVRWLVSAAVTFAEHGRSGDQRALGMGLAMLFDMVKISDTERRMSGQPSRIPFTIQKDGPRYGIPFGLRPYSRKWGDLDRTILARLWMLSEREPVMQPLGQALLTEVMLDDRSIFGRLQRIKARHHG